MKYILAEKIIENIKFKRDHCDPNMKRRAGYDSAIDIIRREQHGTVVKDMVTEFQKQLNDCSTIMVYRGEELIVIPKFEYLTVLKRLHRIEDEAFRELEKEDYEASRALEEQ